MENLTFQTLTLVKKQLKKYEFNDDFIVAFKKLCSVRGKIEFLVWK